MLTVFPRISALGLFEWFIRRVCVCGLGGGGGGGGGGGVGGGGGGAAYNKIFF